MEENRENRANQEPNNDNQSSGYYTRRYGDIIQDEPEKAKRDFKDTFSSTSYGGFNVERENRKRKEKARYSIAVVILCAVLSAVIGAAGAAAVFKLSSRQEPSQYIPPVQNGSSNISINVDENVTSVVEAVAQKASNSVVCIRTTTSVNNFFFGNSESTGEGSGVVYSADGYIVTNYHVIENAVQSSSASKIEVFIGPNDNTSYPAKIIGYNISTDLAVIKIDARGLTPIEKATSKDLKVGQFVVTIGSPGGLDFRGSVTYGVISGLDRKVASDSNVKLIQTDAAINPGNSGGALLDTSGKLVGINSSKIVSTDYEGMGFAIPVDTVTEKVEKIISKQSEEDAYIGLSISKKYTEDVLSYYGFPNGAVVTSVDDGSPAEKAGINRGDIITEFNETEVKSAVLFEEMISECEPGQTVKVKFYRSGKYYSTEITAKSDSKE